MREKNWKGPKNYKKDNLVPKEAYSEIDYSPEHQSL